MTSMKSPGFLVVFKPCDVASDFSDANVQFDTPNSDVITANTSSRKLPYQGKHKLHMVMLAHLLTIGG